MVPCFESSERVTRDTDSLGNQGRRQTSPLAREHQTLTEGGELPLSAREGTLMNVWHDAYLRHSA